MKRLQTFKFEINPTGKQQRQMRRFARSCRFVSNKALALQKQRYELGGNKLGYVKNLERGYENYFAKRAGYPRFKQKGQHESFRYPDSKQIKLDQSNSRIMLPKLGWLRYRNSRDVLGTVKNVIVSQSCGKWSVSILTAREVEQPISNGGALGTATQSADDCYGSAQMEAAFNCSDWVLPLRQAGEDIK